MRRTFESEHRKDFIDAFVPPIIAPR